MLFKVRVRFRTESRDDVNVFSRVKEAKPVLREMVSCGEERMRMMADV